MNFEAWDVDLSTASAVHECGFRITVEGDPANPNGVHPGKFPEGLTAVEQARLLRCGLEAMQKRASANSVHKGKTSFQERRAAVPQHKPERPILSLKKNAN